MTNFVEYWYDPRKFRRRLSILLTILLYCISFSHWWLHYFFLVFLISWSFNFRKIFGFISVNITQSWRNVMYRIRQLSEYEIFRNWWTHVNRRWHILNGTRWIHGSSPIRAFASSIELCKCLLSPQNPFFSHSQNNPINL